MAAPSPRASRASRRCAARNAGLLLAGGLVALFAPGAAPAQQQGYGQTLGTSPQERQLFDADPRGGSGGSGLDSTNPLDLMNKIRRNTAMDEATPPSSAIDQALREFEAQSPAGVAPASGLRPAAP